RPPHVSDIFSLSFLLPRHPPTSTLFPYTTLFRSRELRAGGLAPHLRGRPRGARADGDLHRWRGRTAGGPGAHRPGRPHATGCPRDRKSTRLNSSHLGISYAVFCLKKKKTERQKQT